MQFHTKGCTAGEALTHLGVAAGSPLRGKPAYLGVAISGLSVQETAFLEVLDNFQGIHTLVPAGKPRIGAATHWCPRPRCLTSCSRGDKMRMLGWSILSTCPDGWNGQKEGGRLKLSLRRG